MHFKDYSVVFGWEFRTEWKGIEFIFLLCFFAIELDTRVFKLHLNPLHISYDSNIIFLAKNPSCYTRGRREKVGLWGNAKFKSSNVLPRFPLVEQSNWFFSWKSSLFSYVGFLKCWNLRSCQYLLDRLLWYL